MNLFEAVKASVSTRDVAEHYGIKVDRAGKACCIFHDDHHPSMKVDERFHCFSCGADGDVIAFASQLFGVGMKEAAIQLASDFNIPYDRARTGRKPARTNQINARKSLIQRLKNYQNENYRAICSYFHLLRQWEAEFAPRSENEEWHPLFIEAIKNSVRVEYLLDELQGCSPDEAKTVIALHKNEIARYANRVREVHAAEKHISNEIAR